MKNREVRKQRKTRERTRELEARILPTAAEWSAEQDRAEEHADLGWAYMSHSATGDQGIE